MPLFFIAVAALWSADNADFINTSNKQLASGYEWYMIDCRAPDTSLPNIVITSPNDNKFVCFKLQ